MTSNNLVETCITLPYRSASCIDAPAAWLTRNFHTLRSFAATSASSTDHPKSILLMSLFMVSFHAVLGRPRLLPWVGFQEYSLLGMWEASMRCTWPNHFKRLFLMTDVSWGCLVLDLMLSFEICWNQTIFRIFLWHLMSNASSLASSLSWGSSIQRHTRVWKVHRRCKISSWCLNWCYGLSTLCQVPWMQQMLCRFCC